MYEEEYLVNSVGRLIDRLNSVVDDVGRLIEALMRRGMRERAVAVNNSIAEVTQRCQEVIPEVIQCQGKKTGTVEKEARPKGADAVLFDAVEGTNWKEPPVVKILERLALLG